MKFLLSITAILVAVSVSHAITSIPINGIKASSTLPDLGQKSYRPENMIMKKNVHPFFQVWAAKYKEKPITLEFIVEAQELDVITLYNGYMRDSSSYTNYSLAKNIKIYQNSIDNPVKSFTLAKPKWGGFKIHRPDIIVFENPLKNVYKIIIEIEDIYPGKIYQDVCIALVKSDDRSSRWANLPHSQGWRTDLDGSGFALQDARQQALRRPRQAETEAPCRCRP